MKKILLSVSLAALMFSGFWGCTQQQKWNREERQSLREMLRNYRKMVYLNDLTEAEYMLFSDNVATAIEENFPVYTSFIQMPGVADTVQVYVVTTIVEELNADARNMRHIYPYNYLVSQNILPSGLDRPQQNAFYRCLAQKVNNTYPTLDAFVNAIVTDTTATSTMQQLQLQCAADLFNWEIDIIEITEN